MEERLKIVERKLEDASFKTEKIKDYVLGSVKIQLEEWLHDTLTISCITEEIESRYKRTKNDMAEYGKDHRKLEKELNDTREEMKVQFTELCKIKNFLDDILTDLKLKCYKGDLEALARVVDDKCSWDFSIDLANQIKTLAKIDDLKDLQQSFNDFKKTISKEYILKNEAIDIFTKMKNKLKTMVSENTTKQETKEAVNKIYERFTQNDIKIEEIFEKQKISNENFIKSIDKIRADFSDNVKQFQFDRIQKEVSNKASKSELERFLGENLPKITEFNHEFKKIKQILESQDKAMTRIDEISLQKASKVEFMLLKESLSKSSSVSIAAQLESLQTQVQKSDIKLASLIDAFNEYKDSNSDKSPYKLTLESEISLLKLNLYDLENKISYKADLAETLQKLENKASWEDFSHLAESIESVHMQIKLLALQIPIKDNSKRANSHSKITRKFIDMVIASRPTLEDIPTSNMKSFVKFPHTPEYTKNRINTPSKKLFNCANTSPSNFQ
jgi:hypothetical protein